ncbi:hypothetical protein BCR39DRAFT_513544 [Naematelia encephala]|uniref:Translation initiation factor eIF2B subunit beta n=1 Tax=Naematelia encephala TaxID=71784 RepID=A0A1Y2BII6_9TREE|nr:hypothetical protein BCR39DRAFT_513544 [Naematelia encephala]
MVSQILLKPSDPNAKLTEALITSLRRREIVGSRNVALATAAVVQNIVRSVKFTTIEELIGLIKGVGRRLVDANPKELAAGNIIRRILRLIREEYSAAVQAHLSTTPSAPGTPDLGPETPGLHAPQNHYLSFMTDLAFSTPGSGPSSSLPLQRQTSLSNFVAMRHSRAQAQMERAGSALDLSAATSSLFTSPGRSDSADGRWSNTNLAGLSSRRGSDDFGKQAGRLKPVLVQAIDEVVNELETTHEDVAKGAKEHIHSSEVILTLGHSKTVEAFLKQAYRDRKFTVIVAESAPSYLGHSMASSLSASGIPVLLIPDSAVHAVMPRTTKLILGAHTVLANGGLFALAGALAAALAAKAHAKPVVVTTGQFKFAPAWNLYHEYGAADLQSPGAVLGFDGDGSVDGVEGVVPYYEYIRPELVNLFVTNEGDHSPSYIYRIIKEAYDDVDVEL